MPVNKKIYNEFLAAKIKEGREDILAGRYIKLEKAKTRMRLTIKKASMSLNASTDK